MELCFVTSGSRYARDFSDFAIELRSDPAKDWLWAVVDAEGLTLGSGCSRSQTAAWRTAMHAAEAIQQSRDGAAPIAEGIGPASLD